MTLSKRVRINCDIPWCENSIDFDHQYGPAARHELEETGWVHDGRKDFCPQHVKLGTTKAPSLRAIHD